MKKLKLLCVFASFFGLLGSPSYAADITDNIYAIEVCSIPLSEIVIEGAKSLVSALDLQHMFVRGYDGTVTTGLNFEPINPMEFMGGKAKIGKQNYSAAMCRPIMATANKEEYLYKWKAIVEGFEKAAQKYHYSVLDKHCQAVTEEVLCELGYAIPEEIASKFQTQNNLAGAVNGCAQQ
jgi:hypothetical protein